MPSRVIYDVGEKRCGPEPMARSVPAAVDTRSESCRAPKSVSLHASLSTHT